MFSTHSNQSDKITRVRSGEATRLINNLCRFRYEKRCRRTRVKRIELSKRLPIFDRKWPGAGFKTRRRAPRNKSELVYRNKFFFCKKRGRTDFIFCEK